MTPTGPVMRIMSRPSASNVAAAIGRSNVTSIEFVEPFNTKLSLVAG